MKKVLYVAIDVDDKNFHGAGVCRGSEECFSFRCKPTFGALQQQLKKLQNRGYQLRTCYEATYIGYFLHRSLINSGINNVIIAPSLIPTLPGRQVKTDRVDAERLAVLFAKDELTPIHIPDEEDEQIRAFIRTRAYVVQQRASLKRHTLSLMRQLGFNYKLESSSKAHWTQKHLQWIRAKAAASSPVVAETLGMLLTHYAFIGMQIADYDAKIKQLSELPRYRKQVAYLCCFRGIGVLSAMTLVVEIGDARRFPHPRQLTSYSGLDIREYSSGGKEKKFGITKMGNHNIRRTVIESCQRVGLRCLVSKRLKVARAGQPPQVIEVADRCMQRLRQRYYHLLRPTFCRLLAP